MDSHPQERNDIMISSMSTIPPTDLYSPDATLTTHSLDIHNGQPSAGLNTTLFAVEDDVELELMTERLDIDGRCRLPMLNQRSCSKGSYRLRFRTAEYLQIDTIFKTVDIDFFIDDPGSHFHVPLIVAPGGYSTYRGVPPSRAPSPSTFKLSPIIPSHSIGTTKSAPSSGGQGLSIHFIDIVRGWGAENLCGTLNYRSTNIGTGTINILKRFTINSEGRTQSWLVPDGDLRIGEYTIEVDLDGYHRNIGFITGSTNFFHRARINLNITDPDRHHHIVMLLSPFSYSIYRGS